MKKILILLFLVVFLLGCTKVRLTSEIKETAEIKIIDNKTIVEEKEPPKAPTETPSTVNVAEETNVEDFGDVV